MRGHRLSSLKTRRSPVCWRLRREGVDDADLAPLVGGDGHLLIGRAEIAYWRLGLAQGVCSRRHRPQQHDAALVLASLASLSQIE